jgi:hypothetical protein
VKKFKFTILEWILLFFVIHTLLFPVFQKHYTKNLIDMPISFSPPSTIDEKISIPFSEIYSLDFYFEKNEDTRGQIVYLIGEGHDSPPVKPIPLEVTFYSVPDMKLILSKKTAALFSIQWRSLGERSEANLSTSFDLMPGSYRMIVKSPSDIPFSPTINGELELFGGGWRPKGVPQDKIVSPIEIGANGRFELQRDIQITGKGNYILLLRLSDEEEKLKNAIGGGKPVGRENVGTPIPVALQIFSLPDNRLVMKKDIVTHNTYAWSRDFAVRHIDSIRLPAGDYRFIIQMPTDIPALADIKAKVKMGLRGKSSSTWQMTYIIWANLLYPVVLFIDLILLVLVCYMRVKKSPNAKGNSQ